jgi:hypothetical protein
MAYKQAENRRKKLAKTYEETKNSYGSGVWFDEVKNRYIKYTASNTPGYTKLLKRISNKKVRKTEDIGNFNIYRRSYDYKWELY